MNPEHRFRDFLSRCTPQYWLIRVRNQRTGASFTLQPQPDLSALLVQVRERCGDDPVRLKATRRTGIRPEQFDPEREALGLSVGQGGPVLTVGLAEVADDELHEREAAPEHPLLPDEDEDADSDADDAEEFPDEPDPRRIRRRVAAVRAQAELRRAEMELQQLGEPKADPWAGLAGKVSPWIPLLAPVLKAFFSPRTDPELVKVLARLEAQQRVSTPGSLGETLKTIAAVRDLFDGGTDAEPEPMTAIGEAAALVRETAGLLHTVTPPQAPGQVIQGPRPTPTPDPVLPAPPVAPAAKTDSRSVAVQEILELLMATPEDEPIAVTAARTLPKVLACRWLAGEILLDCRWRNLWRVIKPELPTDVQLVGDVLTIEQRARIEEWAEATAELIADRDDDDDEKETPRRVAQ